jgi:phosphoribosylglycinamide formyltransferase-1
MVNLAIFVSGNGTNCENIIKYFQNSEIVKTAVVISSRKDAYALVRAEKLHVANLILNKQQINDKDYILGVLQQYQVDFIVLAGFLLMIPDFLIDSFPKKIINLHPALLPKFGGKGMYGHHVHKAVKEAGENKTGMTVHYVSPVCDGGDIISQFECTVDKNDTPEDIARKENELEMKYFPEVIEMVIRKTFYSS